MRIELTFREGDREPQFVSELKVEALSSARGRKARKAGEATGGGSGEVGQKRLVLQ